MLSGERRTADAGSACCGGLCVVVARHAHHVTGVVPAAEPEQAQIWSMLVAAHSGYRREVAAAYDEVLLDVVDRVAATGSLGKSDIGALLLWKRLRADTPWAADLLTLPDSDVRTVTARAVDAVRDQSLSSVEAARLGRSSLSPLPGFRVGDALASALLFAAAPDRMAIYDKRAHHGLTILQRTLTNTPGRYGRYIEHLEQLRTLGHHHGADWTTRDVDIALYWLGSNQPTHRLRNTD